jgi:3-methyl-2-oxobutanoate hydroxymethyltransferase
MGHIGLTPQSFNRLGGYRLQGKTAETAQALIDDAKALEDAGVFSIVLELVPRGLAEQITKAVKISTIGIGAGIDCDVQVLVLHDLLGLTFGRNPRFVRKYANLREIMSEAVQNWASDVKKGNYPNEDESYGLPGEAKVASKS